MARRMADKSFRDEQMQHLYDEHIAPISLLVDELRRVPGLGQAPYVPPMYGGVNARLLSVLRDPGSKTQDEGGSGFLSMENNDDTAERICHLFAGAGIGAGDIVPWNAYPWYIGREPTDEELMDGVEPLKRLIDILPRLQVVMVHGGSARTGWRKLTRSYPSLVTDRGLHVIMTYHTSPQAFFHPSEDVRQARKDHLVESFAQAARHLRLR